MHQRSQEGPNSVSIHAPRVGSDFPRMRDTRQPECFNPRSPCGERPDRYRDVQRWVYVSIHAPRVGSDGSPGKLLGCLCLECYTRGPVDIARLFTMRQYRRHA